MAMAILNYTLDSLIFSRTILQTILKVFCGQNWWLYSCSCVRTQHWCGVDVPTIPLQCTCKLFIESYITLGKKIFKNTSDLFLLIPCMLCNIRIKRKKWKTLLPFDVKSWGWERRCSLPGRCLTWQVCSVAPQSSKKVCGICSTQVQ